jgi:hypothetical protein
MPVRIRTWSVPVWPRPCCATGSGRSSMLRAARCPSARYWTAYRPDRRARSPEFPSRWASTWLASSWWASSSSAAWSATTCCQGCAHGCRGSRRCPSVRCLHSRNRRTSGRWSSRTNRSRSHPTTRTIRRLVRPQRSRASTLLPRRCRRPPPARVRGACVVAQLRRVGVRAAALPRLRGVTPVRSRRHSANYRPHAMGPEWCPLEAHCVR